MEPNNNSIITEDGQRLTIQDGRITGTEDPGPGLAYETGMFWMKPTNQIMKKGMPVLPTKGLTVIVTLNNNLYMISCPIKASNL
jgi:hypothetical protein